MGAASTIPEAARLSRYAVLIDQLRQAVDQPQREVRGKASKSILRLFETSDAFISNYRQAALDRLGLGYEACREQNPALVYAVANGFGPKGPVAERPMTDIAAQARGGLMSMIGEADGPPMRVGATVADLAGAMQLALPTVTALLPRERHGVGQ